MRDQWRELRRQTSFRTNHWDSLGFFNDVERWKKQHLTEIYHYLVYILTVGFFSLCEFRDVCILLGLFEDVCLDMFSLESFNKFHVSDAKPVLFERLPSFLENPLVSSRSFHSAFMSNILCRNWLEGVCSGQSILTKWWKMHHAKPGITSISSSHWSMSSIKCSWSFVQSLLWLWLAKTCRHDGTRWPKDRKSYHKSFSALPPVQR